MLRAFGGAAAFTDGATRPSVLRASMRENERMNENKNESVRQRGGGGRGGRRRVPGAAARFGAEREYILMLFFYSLTPISSGWKEVHISHPLIVFSQILLGI